MPAYKLPTCPQPTCCSEEVSTTVYNDGIELPEHACLACGYVWEAVANTTDGFESYYQRQINWSRETFGPGKRTEGIIDHIKKELFEIQMESAVHEDGSSEWLDVIILAMDGYWRHGGTAAGIMQALKAKQAKNMARKWPDWRGVPEDKATEHIREAGEPAKPAAGGAASGAKQVELPLGIGGENFWTD